MYTVIRRYEADVDTAEVARRAVEEFAPQLKERPGFQGYWAVDAGNGVLATITVFESEEEAVASTAAAAAWVSQNIPEIASVLPQVTSGATTGLMGEVPA
jgi:hypothetical protein